MHFSEVLAGLVHIRAFGLQKRSLDPVSSVAKWKTGSTKPYLVGGLEHEFYDFPYIGNFIIPTDFHVFPYIGISSSQLTNSYFSEGLKPSISLVYFSDYFNLLLSICNVSWVKCLRWG